jgi:hypothetical protein
MSLLILNKEKRTATRLDLDNYKKVGCLAVDMTCEAIIYTRKQGVEPKAIILHPAYYQMFQAWAAKEYGEETALKEFYIDGIQIRKETLISGKSLMIEYYKPTPQQNEC